MFNILIFGMNDNPGGVESFLMNYARNFDKTKVHMDFLCNTKVVAYENELTDMGCKVIKVTARRDNPVRYKKDMKAFFKDHAAEYDVIWVNLCSLANIDYLKMAKKYGIPVRIIHSHNSRNMDSRLRGILHKINKKKIGRIATDYWACSYEAAKWFYPDKIINSGQYRLIYNAIDTSSYRFNEDIRDNYRKELNIEDKIVLGHIGRMHFQKNQSFLLEIFAEFKKIHSNSVLMLIGQGEDEDMLHEKTKLLGITDSVMFMGIRNDVKNLLMAMDVFVFPSLFEGLSVVAMEVQSSGLPAVASDNVIPDYAVADENFHRISLERGAADWAKEADLLLKSDDINRKNGVDKVKAAGFDIVSQAKDLQDWFLAKKR